MNTQTTQKTPTKGITVETCLGSMHFERKDDLCNAIGELYRAVNASNLQAAKAYFALGEMLMKSHAEMLKLDQSASMRRLMVDSGVHPQKGKRAIKWYAMLKDPDDGSFSEALYDEGAHEVAEAIRSGEQRGKLDADGNPSVRSMESRLGLRGQRERDLVCSGTVKDPWVPSSESFKLGDYVDPTPNAPSSIDQMWDSIGALADGEPAHEPSVDLMERTPAGRRLHQAPMNQTTGTAGDQMMIDFDFRAGGLAVHEQLDAVAEMFDSGSLDPAHAAGVQRKVDQLMEYIGSIEHDEHLEHQEHESGAP